jgi:hypothetical protein
MSETKALIWTGDDENGYIGRVGDEELYRVNTWMSQSTGQGKNKKPGHRVFEPCQRSVFFPPIRPDPSKSGYVYTADEAKARCEADYAKRCGRGGP